jgi:hypothetical protein
MPDDWSPEETDDPGFADRQLSPVGALLGCQSLKCVGVNFCCTPQTSQRHWQLAWHCPQMPMMTPAKDLPPKPLQAGQAIALWPWHLGHKVLVGIARPLSSNNTEGKRGRDYTCGWASVSRFITKRPRSRLTIRQRSRVLQDWPPA